MTIPAGAGRANKESQFITLLVMKYVLPLSIILYLLLPIKILYFSEFWRVRQSLGTKVNLSQYIERMPGATGKSAIPINVDYYFFGFLHALCCMPFEELPRGSSGRKGDAGHPGES